VPFSELTEESIRCRVTNHNWKPEDATKVIGAFETKESCERCKSQRISIISNRGEVISRHIRYAARYLSPDGRVTADERGAMRLQVIQWDYKLTP
jgi:hypothetical protein